MSGDAICGGGHQSRDWTKKEIKEHLKPENIGACLDCYCGIPFKKKGERCEE